jgi:hypothetical protein
MLDLKPSEAFWSQLRQLTAADLDDPSVEHAKGDATRFDEQELEPGTKYRQTGALFMNGVHPQDVKQGQIADCALMAALAAVA